jgi:8-oxo-dGTP pyrophosphatase MutT (NUDIX family)
MDDSTPPPLPPQHVRDKGDAWVQGPGDERFWGRYGAAGLLVWHRDVGILMQHRVGWSHFGGTWGLPGGARKEFETAIDGAFREAQEEAGVPAELLTVLFTSVYDRGFWSYTTVVAEASEVFEPVIGDAESVALEWVSVDAVEARSLHPGFAASWPQLRDQLPR